MCEYSNTIRVNSKSPIDWWNIPIQIGTFIWINNAPIITWKVIIDNIPSKIILIFFEIVLKYFLNAINKLIKIKTSSIAITLWLKCIIWNISLKLGKKLSEHPGQLLQDKEAPYFEVNAPNAAAVIVKKPLKNVVIFINLLATKVLPAKLYVLRIIKRVVK